jgi:uncharacterized repeat protein (TIGR03803 family)
MTKLNKWKMICAVSLLNAASAVALKAQVFTTLVNFNGSNGYSPDQTSLIQGTDGNLYGNTTSGGKNENGTIFKTSTAGALTTLYSFCSQPNCSDGDTPQGALIQATDGNFYGTTNYGGNSCPTYGNCGTVFRMTPEGVLSTLYRFCARPHCPDGALPVAGLLQATNGNFYGTTPVGGRCQQGNQGCGGTIFEMTPSGQLKTLVRFDGSDGESPEDALIQGTNGELYGTAIQVVFDITLSGNLEVLAKLSDLRGSLVQATDGNFYGTSTYSGAYDMGTVFKMTPAGAVTTLHSFNGTDGSQPYAGLIQATDGNFYGTTTMGGAYQYGTIFQMMPDGTVTALHSFNFTVDGEGYGGLFQATDGVIYGTTPLGGEDGAGTIFSLDMGLGPFVTFIRNPARISQPFGILGQGLTGTTNVMLNGTSATFTVESDTLIEATVPPGATTGYVSVTTPTGVLTSNVPFQVIP